MDVLPKLYYGDITLTSCKWIGSFILETFTETLSLLWNISNPITIEVPFLQFLCF